MRSGREHNTPDKAMWGFSCTVRAQVKCSSSFLHSFIWNSHYRIWWPSCLFWECLLLRHLGVIRGCLGRSSLPGRPCPWSVSVGLLDASHPVQRSRGDKGRGGLSWLAVLKAAAKVMQPINCTTNCIPVVLIIPRNHVFKIAHCLTHLCFFLGVSGKLKRMGPYPLPSRQAPHLCHLRSKRTGSSHTRQMC